MLNAYNEGARHECILSLSQGVLLNMDISMLVQRSFSCGEIQVK